MYCCSLGNTYDAMAPRPIFPTDTHTNRNTLALTSSHTHILHLSLFILNTHTSTHTDTQMYHSLIVNLMRHIIMSMTSEMRVGRGMLRCMYCTVRTYRVRGANQDENSSLALYPGIPLLLNSQANSQCTFYCLSMQHGLHS